MGDFNANLSRASLFGDILLKFCVDNSIDIVDHATLSNNTYTYTSYSCGTTSWLDHVLCTADAKLYTSCLDVRYDCVLSDHHPIIGKIDLNIITACQAERGCDLNSTLHRDKLSDIAVRHYERQTERVFNNLNIPDGMKCSDPNCQNPGHINDIDSFYDNIFTVLTECSESLANVNSTRQRHNVPGWNAHVREVHAAARDAYLLWKIGGRPRQAVLYDLMRNSRLRLKHALRMCKNKKNAIIADNIADNLCNKDDRTFWRDIKNVTNSKVKLPSRIGDVHGSNAVAGMWKEHYSSIFNAVSGSNSTELHKELCDAHYVIDRSMYVSPSEITEIINALPCNKSPGLDGLSSEHLKYASGQMPVPLSILTMCKTRPAGRVRPATRFCPAREMFLNYNGNRPRHAIDQPHTIYNRGSLSGLSCLPLKTNVISISLFRNKIEYTFSGSSREGHNEVSNISH